MRKNYPCIFFVIKSLTIDDVEVSRDAVFQEIRQGAGFETGDFVRETLGGLPTVERLLSRSHPKNEFEGIRSHNPTKLLRLVLRKYVLVKLLDYSIQPLVPHSSSSIADRYIII